MDRAPPLLTCQKIHQSNFCPFFLHNGLYEIFGKEKCESFNILEYSFIEIHQESNKFNNFVKCYTVHIDNNGYVPISTN